MSKLKKVGDMDYLEYQISKSKLTKQDVADSLKISVQTLYNKLSGAADFKASEMYALKKELNLGADDFKRCFF